MAASAFTCGVDEAGRGSLAGPLCAAAVVLDPRRPIAGVKDSKALTPKQREALALEIRSSALAYGIGWVWVHEIDSRGIEWANRIAFTRAVRNLMRSADHVQTDAWVVLIDGNRPAWRLGVKQTLIVKGDEKRPEISAASILAKTARDQYVLERMHPAYPQYGFDRHKGYATRAHREAIARWGATPHHRLSFRLGELCPDEAVGSSAGEGAEVAAR